MKNILLFTIISFAILLQINSCIQKDSGSEQSVDTNIVNREIGKSCFKDQSSSCDKGLFTRNIEIPGFDNCYFIVSATYYYCFALNGQSFHLSDFEIIEYGCEAYEDSLSFHNNNGTLAEFESRFNQLVWQQITWGLLSDVNSVDETITFTYNSSNCSKSCYYVVNHGDQSSIRRKSLACGTGCCRIQRVYVRANDNWELVSITDTSDTSDCFDDNPQPCDLNTIYTTDCRFKCDDFLF